jgi:hypothetical protein
MIDMTDNSGLLLRVRSQYKRLEQLTWTVRELQNRFPLGIPENEKELLKNYLALRLDIKDIYDEIEALRKEYGKDR